MAEIVFALYRPKPGREAELAAIVDNHVVELRKLGLVTDRAPVVARSRKDGTIIEAFEWASAEELMYKTTALVLRKPGLRGLLINLYGGINPIHEGAKGIVRVLKEQKVTFPVVAKALGNRQEETWATLKEAGVIIVTDITTEAAVDALCAALEGSPRS